MNTIVRTLVALSAIALFGPSAGFGEGAGSAPDLYVSSTGSDAGACLASAPCLTFDRAYHLGRLGQTVEIAAGTYGPQTINPPGKSGNGVVLFRPAPGAKVTTGEVRTVSVNRIEFRDFSASDFYITSDSDGNNPSDSITLRGISTTEWFIRSSNNIRVIGGESGYSQRADADTIGAYGDSSVAPRNILIDGTVIRDQQRTLCPGCHSDGIFVQSVDGLVIRNTRFYNVDILPLYFSRINNMVTSKNVLVENNFIDHPNPEGYYPIEFTWEGKGQDAPFENITIRFNSLGGSINFPPDPGWCVPGTCRVIGNTGPMSQGQCVSSVVYSYNVWQGADCGPTDRNAASLGFVDGSNWATSGRFDFNLTPGAPQLGYVPTSAGGPATDIDGDARPQRAARDAGADQREPASIVIGRSIGAVSLGMNEADVAKFYGRPRKVAKRAFPASGRKGRTATFALHGGSLWVTYDRGRVVGIGTSSSYYTATGGAGPGAPIVSPSRNGLRWRPCPGVYSRTTTAVATSFAPVGGTRGGTIATVSIVSRGYDNNVRRCT